VRIRKIAAAYNSEQSKKGQITGSFTDR